MAEGGDGEKAGGEPFAMGTENFQAMREGNRAELDRKALVLMSEKIGE